LYSRTLAVEQKIALICLGSGEPAIAIWPLESSGEFSLQFVGNNRERRTARAACASPSHRRDSGVYAGGYGGHGEGCSPRCAGVAGRGDYPGQYLSSLPAAGA